MSTTATTDRTTTDEWANCPDWCEYHSDPEFDDGSLGVIHKRDVTVGNMAVWLSSCDDDDPSGVVTLTSPMREDLVGQDVHDLMAALKQASDLAEGAKPGELFCHTCAPLGAESFEAGVRHGRRAARVGTR